MTCPLCGGPPRGPAFPYTTRWEGHDFRYVRCADCGAAYVSPLPDDAMLRRIYAWGEYHAAHYADARGGERHARTLATLESERPQRGRLLDFGCGAGEFMLAATGRGWACAGVEYESSTIAAAAERTGLPVRSLADTLATGERFDVVHLADVVAHLPRPADTLRDLERLLVPGGRFVITGPLERGRSLVHWVSAGTGAARRLVGRPPAGSGPPTMLVRTDARAQRDFFARLGYRELRFDVYETGWPYLAAPSRLRRAVGRAAVALARIVPNASLGNRFLAVLSPGAR